MTKLRKRASSYAPRSRTTKSQPPLVDLILQEISARGLSYCSVCEAAGLNRDFLSYTMRRSASPRLDHLTAIAGALGFDIVLRPHERQVPAAVPSLRVGEIFPNIWLGQYTMNETPRWSVSTGSQEAPVLMGNFAHREVAVSYAKGLRQEILVEEMAALRANLT